MGCQRTCPIEGERQLPRSLLGLSYPQLKENFVFCPFYDTVYAIQTGTLTPTIPPSYSERAESSLTLSDEEIDRARSNPYVHSITLAVIHRLEESYRLLGRSSASMDEKERYLIGLYQDSHLPLAAYIAYSHEISDLRLMGRDTEVEDDRAMTAPIPYRMFYPEKNLGAELHFSGNLPDLTACIDLGSLWFDIRPKSDGICSAVIHEIVCKTQGHKCQQRNFFAILNAYFTRYPILLKLFREIVFVSLLGNYPGPRYRPRLSRRMEIWRSMQEEITSDTNFVLWIERNESLVCYMTREAYIYSVEANSVLDRALQETTHWQETKALVWEAMDAMRARLDLADANTDYLDGFQKELKLNRQASLGYISKLKKDDFIGILIAEMNKHKERFLIDPLSTMPLVSEVEAGFDETRLELLERIASFLARKVEVSQFDVRWLRPLGLGTEEALDIIKRIYFYYEERDIPDNALAGKIADLYRSSARDFFIIHSFLLAIDRHRNYNEYRLPLDYINNQEMALRAKYGVMPWDPLPEFADVYYYCPSCASWSHPDVDKRPTAVYSRGTFRSLYDFGTRSIFCGRQIISTHIKKFLENGLYHLKTLTEPQVEEIREKAKRSPEGLSKEDDKLYGHLPKLATAVRKHKQTTPCRDTRLIPVHMLGIVKKIDGRMYALCEICGFITRFEGNNFSSIGFTCPVHRVDPRRVASLTSSTSRGAVARLSSTGGGRDGHSTSKGAIGLTFEQDVQPKKSNARKGLSSMACPDTATTPATTRSANPNTGDRLDMARQSAGMGLDRQQKRCWYCGITDAQSREDMNFALVDVAMFDSSLDDLEFIVTYLCPRDYGFSRRVFSDSHRLPTTTRVREVIKRCVDNDRSSRKKGRRV